MDDPVVSRRPRRGAASFNTPASSSHDVSTAATTSPEHQARPFAVPVAGSTTHAQAADQGHAPPGGLNPISFLSASSPSRAFSRIWDRFSPPSISSPFSLPHPPSLPSSFLRQSPTTDSLPAPDASPARPDDFARRRVPPKLEQHDSASQLSFSLRRASTGARQAVLPRDRARSRSPSAGRGEGWEPFRLPTMPKWRARGDKGKGKETAIEDGDDDEGERDVRAIAADDEACFVDGWQGKVDFLVSLPSEISLYILLHLDHTSLLQCGLVSRQWRAFALDPLIWRDLFHQNPKWAIRPEAYRAAAASQRAYLANLQTPAQLPHAGGGGGGYFDSRPTMPSIRRAASSFGKAGVKKVVTGADRVSQGSANLGRKLSGVINEIGNLSISSPNGSRNTSRTPSEAGDPPASAEAPTTPRPTTGRRTTSTALMTLSEPAGPSTSTLSTHAFASPPSTSLSRTNSATALSTLASSMSALPPNVSPARRPPQTPGLSTLPPPSPALSLAFAPEAPLFLDWPKLFKDRWVLEHRWDEGKPSWNWLEGHEDSVYCVQFDEKQVVSGSRDRTIRIWDLASGTVSRILTGHEGSILCLQYDDEILVSGSSDSRILVWDLVGEEGTGKGKYEVKRTLIGHAMGVLDLCFDERWIVSCSKDTTTRVWNRHTGEFFRSLSGHRGPVNAVALNANRVLTASGDALMKMWDIETGKTLRTFAGHTRGLACLQWSPSGKEIVSGGNDQVIKLWNAETGECVREFRGHTDLVRSLSFDDVSRKIVSVSYDKTTRVWDADGDRDDSSARQGTPADAAADGTTRKTVAKHRFKSHSSLVFDVAFDVSRIVSSSHDRRILVMDFGAGLDVSKFSS
ncbi:hypothetical protein JCM10212_003252 [Sporobolomyces blumeae]